MRKAVSASIIAITAIIWVLFSYTGYKLYIVHSLSINDSADSYIRLLSYMVVTRFFLAAVFTLGILGLLFLFTKKIWHMKIVLSKLIIIFIGITFIWFIFIFPWKVLILSKIPTPPKTISAIYSFEPWDIESSDHVYVSFSKY